MAHERLSEETFVIMIDHKIIGFLLVARALRQNVPRKQTSYKEHGSKTLLTSKDALTALCQFTARLRKLKRPPLRVAPDHMIVQNKAAPTSPLRTPF